MTGARAILAELLAECEALGIRLALAGDGGLTIDAPQDALTLELLDRLRANKFELLALLGPTVGPEAEPLGPDGWPADCIGPDELTPCPKCGTLESWQSVAGDMFGLTPGKWRCLRCDPPGCRVMVRNFTK